MSDDAQHLIDRLAIQDVLASYYRAIDRRDWDALAAVYADDAVFRSPPRLEQHGRAAIITSTSRVGVYKRTFHFMGNHIAWVNGDGTTPILRRRQEYVRRRPRRDGQWLITTTTGDGEEQEYVIGIRYLDKLSPILLIWRSWTFWTRAPTCQPVQPGVIAARRAVVDRRPADALRLPARRVADPSRHEGGVGLERA